MLTVDYEKSEVVLIEQGVEKRYPFGSPEAFSAISKAWLRIGWDCKYVYSFSWLGRPMIQLPEDMMRMQEVIFNLQPDLIIETGVAHGGSLVFYAGLLKAMGNKGKVIGVDIEIRPHNRSAIENHLLADYITLIEGSSTDQNIVNQVSTNISRDDVVLVVLDSCHTKEHVKKELELYGTLVNCGSYIVATDGIMEDLSGAPRSQDDWQWNNPKQAALEFVTENANFMIEEPNWPFNEGVVNERVTYWPNCWIRKIK